MDGGKRSAHDLMGREREKSLLAQGLHDVRVDRRGTAVLLRGEAGIGKTALLDWTETQARESGFTVLRAVGSEAEQGLAFGALHQVLWPLLEADDTLSPAHRDALHRALGLQEGMPPGGFAVGAAALRLLADAARTAPLALLLDDLHCMDASSATVFAFLNRRIAELPVLIVGTTRPDDGADANAHDGWPTVPVEVGALTPADAGALLRQRYPAMVATAANRVLEAADGNPLAVVELPVQLEEGHVNGHLPMPEMLPLGRRLERLFAGRINSLPPDSLRVLLLSALSGNTAAGNVGAWLRAVSGDAAERTLAHIEASGLARLDESKALVFRHPLVRSAVIAAAPGHARRAAHRTLAETLLPDDPRRLVHEAAAALVPDEDLAARLEHAGRRVAGRGGDAEGALLLDRAAALSPAPEPRARRLTWAAVMAARGGRLSYTAQLVDELKRGPVPPDVAPLFGYAVVYLDQSHHIDFESSFTLLPEVLQALAQPGADSFGGLAEQAYFKLLLATSLTDDPRGWDALERHLATASPLGRLSYRAWADPARTAHGVADELRALLADMSDEQEAGSGWLALWTASAVDAADAELRRRFTGRDGYATQGSLAKAERYQDFLRGNWDTAEICLREAEAAADLGYRSNALLFRFYYAHFLAGRGAEEELRAVDRSIRPVAVAARMRLVPDNLTRLRGLAALGHGRYEEAYAHLAELTEPGVLPRGLPWFHLVFFDFVAAAVHTGRLAEARAHVAAGEAARMEEISDHHAFLLAAATALTAPDDTADARFRDAYAVPGAAQWAFEMARLRLAHGSWLRRRHRAEARAALREAHHTFRRLDAGPWRELAEQELRAAGDPVGAVGAAGALGSTNTLLTAQELRIARLAARGLSNKDIGARLQLSPRTVSAHLYRIFPKLGITSRAAIGRALGGDS
ncbi:AAA family ATPase [Embleya sp. NPDC050493]|uniref:helix-turn-helix transcriptional regulator n=1 Tax=Embleya sp. NPDC050493 TaxID=3363989 RepID=UPI0037A5719E